MSNIKLIQQKIDSILRFLTPHYLKFVNCHMVNYLTDDHWRTFIPGEIQDEISSDASKISELLQKFMTSSTGYDADIAQNYPKTKKFIEETRKFTLTGMPDVCYSLACLQNELKNFGLHVTLESPLKIKEFMSPKKNHEVEIAAQIISDLSKYIETTSDSCQNSIIIDAGDGKGYLSSMLALQYGKLVLGIDASEINTKGAESRKQKMTRNYRPITQFIDENTDFTALAKENFDKSFDNFILTGLHTCGNLAPNSLKIYQNNDKIKGLVNIGCCYHLLVEEFVEDIFYNEQKYEINKNSKGFPLSSYLKDKKIFLGRNARMHASQSVPRFFAEKDLPNKTLHYRAMLEVILQETFTDDLERKKFLVGKSKATNFEEYVESAFKKFNFESKIPSREQINEIEAKYDASLAQLQLFYVLRLFLAPVTESLIILDRLLYLKENEFEKSYIVELFDKVVSPRCYGIISLQSYRYPLIVVIIVDVVLYVVTTVELTLDWHLVSSWNYLYTHHLTRNYLKDLGFRDDYVQLVDSVVEVVLVPFSPILPAECDFSDGCKTAADSELRKLPVVDIICQLPTDNDDDDS
uniref:CSON015562 protein n=1 Tax=Culicoides sonorensis TaxID=179676 RepID=A0A336MDL2_CULSO